MMQLTVNGLQAEHNDCDNSANTWCVCGEWEHTNHSFNFNSIQLNFYKGSQMSGDIWSLSPYDHTRHMN